MKRVVSIILTLALVMGIVAGCGQSKDAGQSAGKTGTQTTSAEGLDLSNPSGNLRVISFEPQLEKEHIEIANKFMEKYPNVKVEYEFPTGNIEEYYQKVDPMIMAGEPIDIAFTTIIFQYQKKARDGMYVPIDEYFQKEGKTPEDVYNVDLRVNGKVYGFPCDAKTFIVFLNKNHLDEAGLSVPPFDWDWNMFRDYAKKLTKGEGANKRYGTYFHIWPQYLYFPIYSTRLGTPLYVDGKFDISDPLYADFLKFRKDMQDVDKSIVPMTEVLSTPTSYSQLFFSQKVSMVPALTSAIADVRKLDTYPHDFVTVFAPLPRADENAPVGRRPSETRFLSIPETSKNVTAAYLFGRYYSEEGMDIKGAGFSAVKGSSKTETLKVMTQSNESNLYDMKSLEDTMNNPQIVDNAFDFVPPYLQAVTDALVQCAQEYLVGGSSLEEALDKFEKTAKEIISREGN